MLNCESLSVRSRLWPAFRQVYIAYVANGLSRIDREKHHVVAAAMATWQPRGWRVSVFLKLRPLPRLRRQELTDVVGLQKVLCLEDEC